MSLPRISPMTSRVALTVDGDNRVWGRSVRKDLIGNTSLTALVVLSATGRLLPAADCALLDDLATALMAADTRIWPPKIGRMIASFGHTASGFCAAQLACASPAIGPLVIGDAAKMLAGLRASLGERSTNREAVEAVMARMLDEGTRLAGFGAPFRLEDERLIALKERVELTGRTGMVHWQLAELVAECASHLRGLRPNIVLHGGALALDVGLAPDEVGDVMLGLVVPLFLGTAREGAQLCEPQLRSLPPSAVEYVGPPQRTSPRAERQDR